MDNPGAYPGGRHPYWIGSRFLNYLEKKKPKTISCLIQANSDSIPFFLNSAFKECVGEDAIDSFNEFRKTWKARSLSKVPKFRSWAKKQQLKPLTPLHGVPIPQQNSVLMKSKFWRLEVDEKNNQRLVSYDLKKKAHQKYYFEGLFEGIHFPSDYSASQNEILLAFLEKQGTVRGWRRWNTIKREASFSIIPQKNASYLFEVAKNTFYYLHYNMGTWELWHKFGDKEKMAFKFPRFMNIFSPRVFDTKDGRWLGFQTFLRSNNDKEVYAYQLLKIDQSMKESKLWVLHQSNKPLQYLESCGGEHLLKQGNSLIVVEQKKANRYLSVIKSKLSQEIIQVRWSQKSSHFLLSSDPQRSYFLNKGCKEVLKKMKRGIKPKVSKRVHRRLKDRSFSLKEKELENYPSLSHFAPKYWLLNVRAGDSASSVSSSTVLRDPRNHHVFGLGLDYYFDLEEFVPIGSYTFNGDWASYSASYSKLFTVNSFSTAPNLSEVSGLSIRKNFKPDEWSHSLTAYLSHENSRDFISQRKSNLYGAQLNMTRPGEGGREAFFQSFSLLVDGSFMMVDGGAEFWRFKSKATLKLRWTDWLFSQAMGTYGKLDKTDFSSGILFGGGNSSYYGSSFHEFYGLDYSDAFGNEIKTGRFQFDIPFWNIYSGSGLSPIYMKRAHLLMGADFIQADRIFVDQSFLFNESLISLHGGVKFDLNLAYLAPIEVDFIYARVLNEFGNDESSIFFLLQGNFGGF